MRVFNKMTRYKINKQKSKIIYICVCANGNQLEDTNEKQMPYIDQKLK